MHDVTTGLGDSEITQLLFVLFVWQLKEERSERNKQ